VPTVTIADAAKITGISDNVIRKACNRGQIDATQGKIAEAGDPGRKHGWLISTGSLLIWEAKRRPREHYHRWSDADVSALHELQNEASVEQLSVYLGIPPNNIRNKMSRLRGDGILADRAPKPKAPKYENYSPFHLTSKSVLLAKTCLRCGSFRSATRFKKKGNHRASVCNTCYASQPHVRKKKKASQRKRRKVLQQITIDRAKKVGEEYTSADIETIMDPDKTNLAVALDLSRSFGGIETKRKNLGYRGSRYRTAAPDWALSLTAINTIVRDTYCGIPQIEDWDWDD
jgi:uncharacterized Zn finger protein (UPF0148 family)